MEVDIDQQKKRACMITPLAGVTTSVRTNKEKIMMHDTKKICNNGTPLQTLKPADKMTFQEDTVMESEINEELQTTEKKFESIQEREKPPEETTEESLTKEEEKGHNLDDNAQDQTTQMTTMIEQKVAEAESTAMASTASGPTEATPKEWQQHHGQMWALMGEENHPKIPDLQEKMQVLCPGPDLDIDVAPVKDYVMRQWEKTKSSFSIKPSANGI